jgi:hypothetical protein
MAMGDQSLLLVMGGIWWLTSVGWRGFGGGGGEGMCMWLEEEKGERVGCAGGRRGERGREGYSLTPTLD